MNFLKKHQFKILIITTITFLTNCEKEDGLNSLIKTTNLVSSENCVNGGTKVDVGLDQNNNQTLELDEIQTTTYICNGDEGVDGVDGVDGDKGINTLTEISAELNGTNCQNGGKKVLVGLDENNNGLLEVGEISNTNYICNSISYSTAKTLIDLGDSLTEGAAGGGINMSSVTQELLGPDWTVKNMGVGGEGSRTIFARHGSLPMYIKKSIIIPADGSDVEIPTGFDDYGNTEYGLYSSYDHKRVNPLVQGSAGINPCYIEGIACTIRRNATTGIYSVKRNTPGTRDYATKEHSLITTYLASQTEGVLTVFVGQNGGYSPQEVYLEQVDKCIAHKGDGKYIIITSHGNGYEDVVEPIKAKYGLKHIDLKKYMSSVAIYDAIDFGLLPDDGTYPTTQDLIDMSNKNAPTSLLSDAIHFNAIGYELLGRLRYQKGVELGYW